MTYHPTSSAASYATQPPTSNARFGANHLPLSINAVADDEMTPLLCNTSRSNGASAPSVASPFYIADTSCLSDAALCTAVLEMLRRNRKRLIQPPSPYPPIRASVAARLDSSLGTGRLSCADAAELVTDIYEYVARSIARWSHASGLTLDELCAVGEGQSRRFRLSDILLVVPRHPPFTFRRPGSDAAVLAELRHELIGRIHATGS